MYRALDKGAPGLLRSLFSRSARSFLSRAEPPRWIQIHAAPFKEPNTLDGNHLPLSRPPNHAVSPDARFDVIGAPYSLLSVSLTASQKLYTRRGTLVGLGGKPGNVVSTLSLLEPFRRAALRIPFLYQKISSTSPVTALISVRSPITTFAVVQLNGTVDWIIAQRQALLAWTGHSMFIRPTVNTYLSVAHWGSSKVVGRGLLALVGNGQVYSVELKSGEQYIAHPSNVIAYTMMSNPPRPYRLESISLRFQVPELHSTEILFRSKFIRDMAGSDTWKALVKIFHGVRTWVRTTIRGDRLFLQFNGPATILLQSRAARIRDVLSTREVNEIAEAPAAATQDAVSTAINNQKIAREREYQVAAEAAVSQAPVPPRSVEQLTNDIKVTRQNTAIIRNGKVEFEKLR